jgi:hypothetical protein
VAYETLVVRGVYGTDKIPFSPFGSFLLMLHPSHLFVAAVRGTVFT